MVAIFARVSTEYFSVNSSGEHDSGFRFGRLAVPDFDLASGADGKSTEYFSVNSSGEHDLAGWRFLNADQESETGTPVFDCEQRPVLIPEVVRSSNVSTLISEFVSDQAFENGFAHCAHHTQCSLILEI